MDEIRETFGAPERDVGLAEIERAVRRAEPAAAFVEPRIIRRVIKQDRRLGSFELHVPHDHVYAIDRDRLLAIANRAELDFAAAADVPGWVILLPRRHSDDPFLDAPGGEILRTYWRQLFHARVHIEVETQLASGTLDDEVIAERIRRIGTTEFAEIRQVLVKEGLLSPAHRMVDAYVEFVATALELRYFAAGDRPLYFPAIRDWPRVDQLLDEHVRADALYYRTRPARARSGSSSSALPCGSSGESEPAPPRSVDWPLLARNCEKLASRADRAARLNNHVRAAVLRMRAAELAPRDSFEARRNDAVEELRALSQRLVRAWDLPEDSIDGWTDALAALLRSATGGPHRIEVRLLYDVQKSCVSLERGVYKFGWFAGWRGMRQGAFRRSLPVLQLALGARQLRTAARRVAKVRVTEEERERLGELLGAAVAQSEEVLRQRIRPLIGSVLDEVGLVARNLPEQVARDKLVEELLDRVVHRGFFNMGDLRDALSLNDLKLPDVSGLAELVHGDMLLRADRRLGRVLEGVYRPGAVYLRIPQRLSSLAFGTRLGRSLTQYVALPFGGAFIAVEAIKYVVSWIWSLGSADDAARTHGAGAETWAFDLAIFPLGLLLLGILHRPKFRARLKAAAAAAGSFARRTLVDLPARLLRAGWVQRMLRSRGFALVRNYGIRPAFATLLFAGLSQLAGAPWNRRFAIEFFLVANLLLNTPVGRLSHEWLMDLLQRTWHEVRIRLFAAVVRWVADAFHRLQEWLEQLIYAVDEWLRFRAGDSRWVVFVKLVLGSVWSVVSYVISIYVTLLIEPQINPIKHFPVVTVSHKIMLPYSLVLTKLFAAPLLPFMNAFTANALAGATVLLLPGVFGFLVWELKENWRLYEANRPKFLKAVPFGPHGETMTALLRPGIHSGTLSKRYAKIRRALGERSSHRPGSATRRGLASLRGIEGAIRAFVTRTMCAILAESGFHHGEPPFVGDILLATNRIDVELRHSSFPGRGVWLRFDDVDGRLTGGIHQPGWLAELNDAEQTVFRRALEGLYRIAGVDFIADSQGGRERPVPIDWNQWVAAWSGSAGAPVAQPDRAALIAPEAPNHADSLATVIRGTSLAPECLPERS